MTEKLLTGTLSLNTNTKTFFYQKPNSYAFLTTLPSSLKLRASHWLPYKGFLAIRRLLSLDAKFSAICRNSAHGCCTWSLKTYGLTAFTVDRRLIFSYVRCQFLCQKAMPFRNFDYRLYVLFSVLYMRKTPIKRGQ